MPIFECECLICYNVIEYLQRHKMSDEELELIVCPKCDIGGFYTPIVSSGGFRLYGEGFYKGNKKDD